jgi:O-antigen/teichoic acid export membrane protein
VGAGAHEAGTTRRLSAALGMLRASHGFRSGLVLGLATLVLNGAGYLFNLACIRYLGSAGYGDVAALMALAALVALPLGSVQNLLAREVAHLHSRGVIQQTRRLLRTTVLIAAPAAVVVLAIGLVLTPQIESAFHIGSAGTVVAGLSVLVFSIMSAILFGFLQGTLRFRQLALTYAVGGSARPLLVVPALLAGLGAAGALAVNTLASLLTVLLAAFLLRDLWFGPLAQRAPALDPLEVAFLVGGSLAFTSLTNTDVLLAAYFLSDTEAGVYAAAAFVGKIVLFLPSAVVMVLLPKASSRAAVGAARRGILLASAGVTAALTVPLATILVFTPEDLLVRVFGGDFRETTELLGWFGFAMAAAALVNVYLFVYFAERDLRFPLLIGAAAVAQVIGIVLFHSDPRSIVLVTLASLTAALVIHEVAFPHRMVRLFRRAEARGDVESALSGKW